MTSERDKASEKRSVALIAEKCWQQFRRAVFRFASIVLLFTSWVPWSLLPNWSFRGWSGPIIGTLVGCVIGFEMSVSGGVVPMMAWVMMWGGMGALAGIILALNDWCKDS